MFERLVKINNRITEQNKSSFIASCVDAEDEREREKKKRLKWREKKACGIKVHENKKNKQKRRENKKNDHETQTRFDQIVEMAKSFELISSNGFSFRSI